MDYPTIDLDLFPCWNKNSFAKESLSTVNYKTSHIIYSPCPKKGVDLICNDPDNTYLQRQFNKQLRVRYSVM
ncbi:uncharacterized protein [Blastocystis hominis]|uniref:Uncharacterized protein n=1 Tax=Blastocystis hominis TaxID=12968 RepID=D8M944_BLAHO|nr:uncharacterized protein [Blastocystis hominis]CBK24583.2 unnamed protein product [Blastocystis hominis]|eukprot:XP_012898631.1 uncharacterized protein [Blastocystis hominis]